MKPLLAVLLLAGCTAVPPADHAAHMAGAKPAAKDRDAMWRTSLTRAPLAVTVAFDARGRLWRAQVENGRLLISHSTNHGITFAPPVVVNAEPERIAADGENRPKLAFGQNGEIYVSWTRSGDKPFSGDVRFSRSLDGGRTFSPAVTVNDDRAPISHRFDALVATPDGHVHVLWLDKRDAAAAAQRGEPYTGISLYHAVSTDRGASFTPNRKLADHTCECCRIATALDADGTPVAVWRHVFGKNIRDHALLRLEAKPVVQRVTHDGWAVDACPHHGPALAIGPDGARHLAWYTGAAGRSGLYYARAAGRAAPFTPPLAFGNNDAQAGHPALAVQGTTVHLAWKEFDGQQSLIRTMASRDGGNNWSAVQTLATSRGRADRPQLIGRGTMTYLAWYTSDEDLRLIAVDAP